MEKYQARVKMYLRIKGKHDRNNIVKNTTGKQDTQCNTDWLFSHEVYLLVVFTSEASKLNSRQLTVFREDKNF